MIKQIYTSSQSTQQTYSSPNKVNNTFSRIISSDITASKTQNSYGQPISNILPVYGQQSSPVREIHYVDQPLQVVPREELESQYQIIITKLEDEKTSLVRENIQLRSVQASEKLSIIEDTTRINFYETENHKLIRTVKEQSNEVSDWKQKYIDFEAQVSFQYGLELDYMRIKKQSQETEIVLRAEIKFLQDTLNDFEQKLVHSANTLGYAQKQTGDAHLDKARQVKDLQNKMAMLTTELERLNTMIEQKNKEINRQKNKFQESENEGFEKDNKISFQSVEINRLKEIIDQRNSELSLLKSKQINPAKYENQILILSQEVEHQLQNLKHKNEECEKYRHEISILTSQLKDSSRTQEFRDRIFRLEGDLQRSNRNLKERDEEIEQLNRQIKRLEDEVQETRYSEEKVTTLTTEVDSWKRRFVDLNRDYHDSQEKLMMNQAQLESMNNKTTTQQTRIESTTRRSNINTMNSNNVQRR